MERKKDIKRSALFDLSAGSARRGGAFIEQGDGLVAVLRCLTRKSWNVAVGKGRVFILIHLRGKVKERERAREKSEIGTYQVASRSKQRHVHPSLRGHVGSHGNGEDKCGREHLGYVIVNNKGTPAGYKMNGKLFRENDSLASTFEPNNNFSFFPTNKQTRE